MLSKLLYLVEHCCNYCAFWIVFLKGRTDKNSHFMLYFFLKWKERNIFIRERRNDQIGDFQGIERGLIYLFREKPFSTVRR